MPPAEPAPADPPARRRVRTCHSCGAEGHDRRNCPNPGSPAVVVPRPLNSLERQVVELTRGQEALRRELAAVRSAIAALNARPRT